jgi:hypothetical protein
MRYKAYAPQGSVFVGAYGHKNQNGTNTALGSPVLTENPYTMSGVDAMDAAVLCRYQPDWGHRFYNLVRPTWIGTPSLTANDEIILLNKLAERYDNKFVDGGIALGELPQTVNQLAGIVGRAAKEIKNLKRSIFEIARGAKVNKDPNFYNVFGTPIGTKRRQIDEAKIGDLWLGGSFGIRPLMNDAFALADYIAAADLRTNKVRARQKGSIMATPIQGTVYSCSGNGIARRQIIAKLQSESSWPSNLGLQDPATIVWELVPWSFAIDWFLPIGGFIAAQSFVMRAKGTFITTNSVEYRGVAVGKLGPIPGTPGWVGISSTGAGVYTSTSVTRTISTSLPGVRLPGLKSSLLGGEPLSRLANAFSLLSNLKTWR